MSFSVSRINRSSVVPDLSVLPTEIGNLYPNLSTMTPSAPYEYHHHYSAPVLYRNREQQVLVCYLPNNSIDGVVSCTYKKDGDRIIFTTDCNAAIVPADAIVDSVEFFGYNGFSTKDVFSIGLGQLNSDITFPLIQDADSSIANDRVGGCRDFFSFDRDGKNIRSIVISDSNVNIALSSPVTQGGLQVVIKYHMKFI